MVKKTIQWLLIAIVIFYLISNPAAAAQTVRSIGESLRHVGEAIFMFFQQLAS